MRLGWSWLLLTACYSRGAVEIHVDPPADVAVTEVELYAAIDGSTTERVRPESYPIPLDAVWWPRDVRSELDVQSMTADGVTFAFEDGATDRFKAVVVVGFSGGVPVAMASHLDVIDIPSNQIDRYILTLQTIEQLPRSASPGMPGLELWGPAADKRACVQVDNIPELEGFSGAKSAMIVTDNDPDCDGLVDDDPHECVSREFMGQKPMTRDALTCALPTTVPAATAGGMADACVAGGATCADGTGLDPAVCSPSSFCMPTAVCGMCRPGACDIQALPDGVLIHVDCTVPVTSDGTGGLKYCEATKMHLDLKTYLPNVACKDSPAAELRRLRVQSWDTNLSWANGARFDIAPVDAAACTFDFTGSGLVPKNLTNNTPLLDVGGMFSTLLTAPAPGRGVLMPIVFHASTVNDCTTAPETTTCTVTGPASADAGFMACIRAPAMSGTIVVD